MADTIIDGTQFNVNNIMYSSLKANDKGGKSLNLLNKYTKTGLRLSTPLMLTWGAGEYIDEKGIGNGKYEMSLQFPQDEYSNEDCNLFLENMKLLEEKIKADALLHSKEWFGKVHKSIDIIEELFTPMLKYSKIKGTSEPDYTKKPVLRLKLPQYEGVWKSEIYDEDGNPLFPNKENSTVSPLDYLKKGATLAAIIQCGGIWFTNGKFTVTWKLLQAVVQKPKDSISGKCLVKLKHADKDKLKNSPTVEHVDIEESVMNAHVEDSDDEAEVVVPTSILDKVKEKEVVPVPELQKVKEEEIKEELVIQVEEEKPKKKIVRKKASDDKQ
jgi:hypothetical protein